MYEIPDANAVLNRGKILNDLRSAGTYPATAEQGLTGIVSDYFSHPELFDAYPALANRPFNVYADPNDAVGGYVKPRTGEVGLNVSLRNGWDNPDRPLGSMVHEMQHVVSSAEMRSGGGSPDSAAKLMDQAFNRDVQPYVNDWIEHSNAQDDIGLIGKTRRLKELKDIASSDSPDMKQLTNSYPYRNMSGMVHNTLGDPVKGQEQEWTRNAAQFLLDTNMDTVSDGTKKRRMLYLLDLPEQGFEQQLKDVQELADTTRAGNSAYKDISQKYYDLRNLDSFQQYQAINDETLAREATDRMNMTAPSALRQLYTSRVEQPEQLWNAMRRFDFSEQ